jgi:hypothetical protein
MSSSEGIPHQQPLDACPVPVSATFERERTCSGNKLVFLVASKVSVDLKGKKLFVSDCITVTADITSHLAQLSATVVSSRLAAEAIVVYDIAKPGGRTLWVAVLLGLPIVGVRCLTGASNRPSHTRRPSAVNSMYA